MAWQPEIPVKIIRRKRRIFPARAVKKNSRINGLPSFSAAGVTIFGMFDLMFNTRRFRPLFFRAQRIRYGKDSLGKGWRYTEG